jgi:hypothetical protein
MRKRLWENITKRRMIVSANNRQVGGDHYNSIYQHWDFIWESGLDYFQAQITKYLCRFDKKNGVEDLNKSLHFLEKYRELLREPSIKNKPIDDDDQQVLVHKNYCKFSRFNNLDRHQQEITSLVSKHKFSITPLQDLLKARDLLRLYIIIKTPSRQTDLEDTDTRPKLHIDNTGMSRPFGYDPTDD